MTNTLRLVALALLTSFVTAIATPAMAGDNEPCGTDTEDGTITCPHIRE